MAMLHGRHGLLCDKMLSQLSSGTVVATLLAPDLDSGQNGMVTYHITGEYCFFIIIFIM